MRAYISDFFYWLGSLFHEHQWDYCDERGRSILVHYRHCTHPECHKIEFRRVGGFE